MNMELFRYLTVAQLEQKAIKGLKITNKSKWLGRKRDFFGVNQAINTLVIIRSYSCGYGECRQC
jgi:hypothetical protein